MMWWYRLFRLEVVKWLLFSGISGCRFGGSIGSMVMIIYFGWLFDFRKVLISLMCLVRCLSLVFELVVVIFLCRWVILDCKLIVCSSLYMVLVFMVVLKLLLCFWWVCRYCFLVSSWWCFRVVRFGLVIMYVLKYSMCLMLCRVMFSIRLMCDGSDLRNQMCVIGEVRLMWFMCLWCILVRVILVLYFLQIMSWCFMCLYLLYRYLQFFIGLKMVVQNRLLCFGLKVWQLMVFGFFILLKDYEWIRFGEVSVILIVLKFSVWCCWLKRLSRFFMVFFRRRNVVLMGFQFIVSGVVVDCCVGMDQLFFSFMLMVSEWIFFMSMLKDFGMFVIILCLLLMMFLYIWLWFCMLLDFIVSIFCRVQVVLQVFSVQIFILLKCWLLNCVLLFSGCWVMSEYGLVEWVCILLLIRWFSFRQCM